MGYYITVTKGWTIDKVMGKVWRKYKKKCEARYGEGLCKIPPKNVEKMCKGKVHENNNSSTVSNLPKKNPAFKSTCTM